MHTPKRSKPARLAAAAALFAGATWALSAVAADTGGAAATAGAIPSPTSSPYTTLAIFGDSLSDSGNNGIFLGTGGPDPTSNTSSPSGAPYSTGTYTNGQVWVNRFATNLGLPTLAAPSLAGGADFAAGGARTNDNALYPPSAKKQVDTFLSGVTALPATGLYVIAIGGNDVRDVGVALNGGAPASTIATAAAAYAAAVGGMVDSLQAKGAQHIVIWDAPDVGKTPAARATPGGAAAGSLIASTFNQALAARLAGEAGVSIFDVYGFVGGIVANPSAYGLTNVTDACGALINACSASLSSSLFFDGIHPTATGHAILAQAMTDFALAAAVPEPASWLLMAWGAGALLVHRRRRG